MTILYIHETSNSFNSKIREMEEKEKELTFGGSPFRLAPNPNVNVKINILRKSWSYIMFMFRRYLSIMKIRSFMIQKSYFIKQEKRIAPVTTGSDQDNHVESAMLSV